MCVSVLTDIETEERLRGTENLPVSFCAGELEGSESVLCVCVML